MLMREAKKGIIEDIRKAAGAEGVDAERLRALIAQGLVAVPRNAGRNFDGRAVGKLVSTKVNANVGTSKDYDEPEDEVEKAKIAVRYGADAVMDLSTGYDRDTVRKRLVKELGVPVGTVPIYHAARKRRNAVDMTTDDFFNSVREHAKDGVDFVTVHCGVNRNALERLRNDPRLLNIVSRGGALTLAWMMHNEKENPFYEEFDYLLEICREYDLTLSLGDGMRPGCLMDASDRPEFMEVVTLGELVRKCRESDVQSIVEGPGHVPLDEVEMTVKAMKKLTCDAPLYLLGPLVTDIAPGYDHVVGAIGGSVAGMAGADFLCIVTASEHLALPTAEDIKEGVVVGKIAAHVADTVKDGQRERSRELDMRMSQARGDLDWKAQVGMAVDPDKATHIRSTRKTEGDTCSMCSDLCAIKLVKDALREGKP